MANKNKHVIIAYFAGTDEAEKAAQQIKDWDKANNDIKLGGIGILTAKDGKIKTRKVGARATGKGAKWGLALGAATGILTGGVTLIGGAIAGVAGGAVVGSLFHRNLGLSDSDWETLSKRLRDGGAALVIMGDEDEVKPTQAKLAELHGEVVDFQVPEATMSQVEEAEDVVLIDQEVEDEDEREVVKLEEIDIEIDDEEFSKIVNLPGSWQAAAGVGCEDWDPDCDGSYLQPQDDGSYRGTFSVPAGDYELKIALNGNWDENYGQDGVFEGVNIYFQVDDSNSVTFSYDMESHALTVS